MKQLNLRVLMLCLLMAMTTQVFAQQPMPAGPGGQGGKGMNDMVCYTTSIHYGDNSAAISKKCNEVAGAVENRGALMASVGEKLLSFAATETFSLVGTGVSAVGKMIKGHKSEWQTAFEKENSYTKDISSVKEIGDFYSETSTKGALDPSNMAFNGFSCIQMRGNDTVLFMSCHLDTTEYGLNNIVRHSKFSLTVDTLVFFPFRCDIPNDNQPFSQKRSTFSFDERCDLMLGIGITMKSSWINQAVQIYNDVELGSFNLRVLIDPKKMNIPDDSLAKMNTACRFVRGNNNNYFDNVDLAGDCFIVPRSYMGVTDSKGNLHDAWGTGQYKFSFTISETCKVKDEFANSKQWKKDWKKMKKQNKKKTTFKEYVQQVWDSNGSQWVVSLLEIPENYMKDYVNTKFGINTNSSAVTSGTNAGNTGSTGTMPTGTMPGGNTGMP